MIEDRASRRIVIIGGGFTGTMVAVHLLNGFGSERRVSRLDLEIVVLEKRPQVGKGLAYSTASLSHLLNVPAGRMSAYPDEPGHFLAFAKSVDERATEQSFVPRSLYGRYLQALIDDAARRARQRGVRYEARECEAVDIAKYPSSSGYVITLKDGKNISADCVVVATGNLQSKPVAQFTQPGLHEYYIHNPWADQAISTISKDDDVLLVGTGLTAIDKILELAGQGHRGKLIAVSRHGLIPGAHSAPVLDPIEIEADQLPASARGMLAYVRKATGKDVDWRRVVDGLRPHSQSWWQNLCLKEQSRFSRHLQSIWDVYRHRMAPEAAPVIDRLLASGQLTVRAGRIRKLVAQPCAVRVDFKERRSSEISNFTVQKIVNCSGFGGPSSNLDSPLFNRLIERGLVKVHALGRGIEADADGRVLAVDGRPHTGLFTAGPVLQAHRFESIAVPELAGQCQRLAQLLLDAISSARVREPQDQPQVDCAACPQDADALIVEQIYLNCLSQASYLVADRNSRVAAVIDPRRDVDIYIECAQRQGLEIKHIILTHVHADFVAGHLELEARTGACIYMGKQAKTAFPFTALGDGDSIRLGGVQLVAMETPGHTPEGICLVAHDTGQGGRARAVFTGDTLFVGDVGRPDLLGSSGFKSEELAAMLFDSLEKLLVLPDETVVYPGHGPGSSCGKQLGSETRSTIGRQRKFNNALKFKEKEGFVESLCANLDKPPSYFSYDAALNTTARPLLDDVINSGLKRIDLSQLLLQKEAGAQLLDVRLGDQFARGHIDGSINVALSGRFASWSGVVLNFELPTYVLCNPGQELEAIVRLARVGLSAAGYFHYPSDLVELGSLVSLRSYRRVSAEELEGLLAGDRRPVVLDVRNSDEWQQNRIAGSLNIPLVTLVSSEPTTLPDESLTVVHCQSGYRSTIAMSLLLNQGHRNVSELIGGIAECSVQ